MPKFVKYYDANRTRKTYPLLRLKPIETKIDSGGVKVELAIIDFNNSSSESYTFTGTYTSIPVVAATVENENVNIFMTLLSTTTVTIESSAPFTGKVHLQIYEDET